MNKSPFAGLYEQCTTLTEDDDPPSASQRETHDRKRRACSGGPALQAARKQVSDLTSRERRRCARNVTVGGSFGASGAACPATCGCSTLKPALPPSAGLDWQRWLPSLDCLLAAKDQGRAARRSASTVFGASTWRVTMSTAGPRREDQRAGIGAVRVRLRSGRRVAEVEVDEVAHFRLPSTSSRARGSPVRPPSTAATNTSRWHGGSAGRAAPAAAGSAGSCGLQCAE